MSAGLQLTQQSGQSKSAKQQRFAPSPFVDTSGNYDRLLEDIWESEMMNTGEGCVRVTGL